MESVRGKNQDLHQEPVFLTNACLYDTLFSNFISIDLQYIPKKKSLLPLIWEPQICLFIESVLLLNWVFLHKIALLSNFFIPLKDLQNASPACI